MMRIHTKTVFQMEADPLVYTLLQDESFDYAGPIAKADRSTQGAAGQNARAAGSTGSNFSTQANQIGGTLIPTLKQEATNPTGYTPQEQANQLTAGEQAAGGAGGAVAGEAGLRAARTNNTGSLSSVLDQAARRTGQTLSENALGVANKSADLAQKKQAQALGQLQGLYGTDTSNALKAMGLQNEDLDTELNAGKSGWLQNGMGILSSLQGAGKTASGFTL